jgi:hypothetical protein
VVFALFIVLKCILILEKTHTSLVQELFLEPAIFY